MRRKEFFKKIDAIIDSEQSSEELKTNATHARAYANDWPFAFDFDIYAGNEVAILIMGAYRFCFAKDRVQETAVTGASYPIFTTKEKRQRFWKNAQA